MELLGIGPLHFVASLLIFVRALGIFTAAPVFGHAHLPVQVKVALALLISFVLFPLVKTPEPQVATNFMLLAAAAVKEAVVGLTIGYVAVLVFVAIQLAGEVTDTQIGFGMASLVDPLLGTQSSLIGQFQYMIVTLFFLAVNGHHFIISALVKSFELIPLGGLTMSPVLGTHLLDILAQVFLIGLRIGGPVMLAVFLSDLALGLLGRSVPQMNLLVVGFPVKIAVGLGMLAVSIPFFLTLSRTLFSDMFRDLLMILHAM